MVKAGLEDIVAGSSTICSVDGKEGRLIDQGYDIHDLAVHSTFEEVVYLLSMTMSLRRCEHFPNKRSRWKSCVLQFRCCLCTIPMTKAKTEKRIFAKRHA